MALAPSDGTARGTPAEGTAPRAGHSTRPQSPPKARHEHQSEAALDPRSQHVAARRLAHRPHTDSSNPRSPDPWIGRPAVGPQRATRSPACPKLRRPREPTRRGRRRRSISAQSTEHGPNACPGSLFPGDGCLPRQGRFVSAQVTRSPGGGGGGGGGTAPKPNVVPFGTRPDRRAREARRRVATTTMTLQRTDHNVSRCKYKVKCLEESH